MMRAHVNLKGIATLGLTVLAVNILTSCGLTENTLADDKKEVVTESTELPETEKDTLQTSLEESTKVPEQDILARSKAQFPADFEALETFGLDEAEQLAIILAARYVDMQQRIDLEALGNLNPQIMAGLKNNEEAFIRQFLTMDDYELFAVDSAILQGDQLSFNAVYCFTIDDSNIGTGQSMLYTKFLYQWTNENWILMETGEDARPDLSGKPNRSLILWEMQDETEKRFGVDNMTKLFLDFGTSYRTEYEKQYGANQ